MPQPRKSAFAAPYIAIVDGLIARRHEIGMTQIELAEAYGEDQSFISRIERRQRRVDVYEFVRLCRALKIRPGEILDKLPSIELGDGGGGRSSIY
jgi:transcriptional regulator with XRE-family HTH domain